MAAEDGALLKAGVHRTHQDSVLQDLGTQRWVWMECGEAMLERGACARLNCAEDSCGHHHGGRRTSEAFSLCFFLFINEDTHPSFAKVQLLKEFWEVRISGCHFSERLSELQGL